MHNTDWFPDIDRYPIALSQQLFLRYTVLYILSGLGRNSPTLLVVSRADVRKSGLTYSRILSLIFLTNFCHSPLT